MNRNFHNSRGSFSHTRNQNPRWRIVIIALVLAFTFGSASQTVPAQAAPDSLAATKVEFRLGVAPVPPPNICVNKPFSFYVDIVKTTHTSFGVEGNTTPLTSYVTGSVNGYVTQGRGQVLAVLAEAGESQYQFNFKSDKPGKTTLRFTAFIQDTWIGANQQVIEVIGSGLIAEEVTVKVIPCKVKVKTIIHFPVQIYDITVMSDDAVMTADEAGTFTGSTSMSWVYSNFNLAPCTIEIGATDSQVDMTGQLDEEGGQFTATQTFQPQTSAGIVTCPLGSGGGSGAFTVAPITFSVASSGGVSTQTATAEGVSGSATIVVTPEDEGAAFVPGDHQVSWDDFSSVFSTLLALH